MGKKYKEVEILNDDFENSFDETNTRSISRKTKGLCELNSEM